MPARCAIKIDVRWVILPTPETAVEIVPGAALARSISCRIDAMPDAGLTAMNIG